MIASTDSVCRTASRCPSCRRRWKATAWCVGGPHRRGPAPAQPPPACRRCQLAAVASSLPAYTPSPHLHPSLPQAVVHFWAAWCEPCAFLDSVLGQLSADSPSVAALRVEAEEAGDVSEKYGVSVVPYFLFFRDGQVADSLEGADAAALTTKFQSLAAGGAAGAAAAAPAPAAAAVQPPAAVGGGGLQERLKQLVNQQPVMLFMKVGLGWHGSLKCGASSGA